MIQIPYTILLPIFLAGMFIVFTVQSIWKSLNKPTPAKGEEVGFTVNRFCENNKVTSMWMQGDKFNLVVSNMYIVRVQLVQGYTLDEVKRKTEAVCQEFAELEKAKMEGETIQ